MISLNLIRQVLNEQLNTALQSLKDKYVGKDKPLSEKDFQDIQDVSQNKFYLTSWITKKVGQGIIKKEDIYKYKEYFDLFEKNKKKFTHKDIHLYKTAEDLQKFLDEVIQVREGDIVFDEIVGKDNFVSKNDIEKLESTKGAKYLGVYEDKKYKYQVFQVFGVNKDTWKLYRDILGKCKGRSRGARIDICTIGSYEYFKNYLTDPKGSSYFVLYNLDDPKSPYQLHYESGQFMDKNDNSRTGIDNLKFFEFVGNKVPKYSLESENFPGSFEIPVKGKGSRDERGRNQGLWKEFEDGKLRSIVTYHNGIPIGPFVHFRRDGKISKKGTQTKNGFDGDYEEYHDDGTIDEKGVYKDGEKSGIWVEGSYYGSYLMIDYDKSPRELSGFTKEDKLRFVGDGEMARNWSYPYGKVLFFYPSGSVQAIGRFGKDLKKLGDWVFYFPNGKIKSEGKFIAGKRQGEWTDVIKTKDGEFIFVTNFWRGIPAEKIKVYKPSGEFFKKLKRDKLPKNFWDNIKINTESFRNT